MSRSTPRLQIHIAKHQYPTKASNQAEDALHDHMALASMTDGRSAAAGAYGTILKWHKLYEAILNNPDIDWYEAAAVFQTWAYLSPMFNLISFAIIHCLNRHRGLFFDAKVDPTTHPEQQRAARASEFDHMGRLP